MKPLFCVLLLLLTSCSRGYFGVETRYHLFYDIPSVQVATPDPQTACPPIGQSLFVHWNLKKIYSCYENWEIRLKIRFSYGCDEEILIPITKYRNGYTYYLLKENYDRKGSILTFQAELIADSTCIEIQKHPLWCERIQFDCNDERSEDSDVEALEGSAE